MTRVLVCGGRDYSDSRRVYQVLDKLHAEAGISCLIQGGARGADALALRWAENISGVPSENYEADWEAHGTFAGPARNKRMLDEGRPDLVIAFPGGRGTADMIRKARKAGVEVVEISHGP
jgi:predicted Rossmann-fold nucleotide-binding protein